MKGYNVHFKVRGKPVEKSVYPMRGGRFGALRFKKHLFEVYGKDVKVRIKKRK